MGQEQSRNSKEAYKTRRPREEEAKKLLRESLLRNNPNDPELKALIDHYLPPKT